jgi:hypothetical protein
MAVLPSSVLDLLSNFVHKSVKVLSTSGTVTGDQYIPGSGEFRGPAASPQRFANEAVIVQQDVRLIQPVPSRPSTPMLTVAL